MADRRKHKDKKKAREISNKNLHNYKGCAPTNPSGRAKGWKGVAKYIRELAGNDGKEIIDILLTDLKNPKTTQKQRFELAKFLLDRGYGKPPEPTDKQSQNQIGIVFNPGNESNTQEAEQPARLEMTDFVDATIVEEKKEEKKEQPKKIVKKKSEPKKPEPKEEEEEDDDNDEELLRELEAL